MKCLKCGRVLVTAPGFRIEDVQDVHILAHQREDLRNALAKLEAREKRELATGTPATAMAYAEAIALIRVALEPVRFEDPDEQAKLEAAKDSYEHGQETEM